MPEGPVHNLYVTLDGKFMFAGDGTPHGYVRRDRCPDGHACVVGEMLTVLIRPMTSDRVPMARPVISTSVG